jgi:hypothetical protein
LLINILAVLFREFGAEVRLIKIYFEGNVAKHFAFAKSLSERESWEEEIKVDEYASLH